MIVRFSCIQPIPQDIIDSERTEYIANTVASLLGVHDIIRRESENNPPEFQYFIIKWNDIDIEVMASDDDDSTLFPYWLTLPSNTTHETINDLVEKLENTFTLVL